MKEIEITMELLSSLEDAVEILKTYEYLGEEKIIDTYFYDPNKFDSMPTKDKELGECLKLRIKNDKVYVSYKIDKYDDKENWLYADNYETEVPNTETALKQFNESNLKEMMTIKKIRRHYSNNNYDIYIEKVKELKNFIEIKKEVDESKTNIYELKKEMKSFADTLNLKISDVLKEGKPEMMLKELNIDIK